MSNPDKSGITKGLPPPTMLIEILTLFPDGIEAILAESMLKRAREFGVVETELIQLRDYATDKHGTVDDKPFGGGPGMVLKAQPIADALAEMKTKHPEPEPTVILTSPQGRLFDQALAEELAEKPRLTFICGHYKGVDQRVIDRHVDLEVSIGDFILTGGELATAVMVDAIVRLLPGVLGDPESAAGDSFTRGLLDHPHYTQPQQWDGMTVPEVLTSGHHAKVEAWRQEQAEQRTKGRRPDLYERWLAEQKRGKKS